MNEREGSMTEFSLLQKISWFLYQKGMGIARPEFLFMTKFGDAKWFEIAEVLMKDNNLEGRTLILDQLLKMNNFRPNPKRPQYLRLLSQFMSKGILDERRRAVKYVDDNSNQFSKQDEVIRGYLITAMRDKDTVTANTAESAIEKLGGIEQDIPKRGYTP